MFSIIDSTVWRTKLEISDTLQFRSRSSAETDCAEIWNPDSIHFRLDAGRGDGFENEDAEMGRTGEGRAPIGDDSDVNSSLFDNEMLE